MLTRPSIFIQKKSQGDMVTLVRIIVERMNLQASQPAFKKKKTLTKPTGEMVLLSVIFSGSNVSSMLGAIVVVAVSHRGHEPQFSSTQKAIY